MAALPLHLDPVPDEAWGSYLNRRAAQHHVTLTELADHLEVRVNHRWPGHYGVIIDQTTATRAASMLGLTQADVNAMQLARYDGRAFDLTGLTVPGTLAAVRTVSARNWVHLSGSAYCPDCLRADGVWRLRWRLPWSTTCPQHAVFLVPRCPRCGQVPQTGNTLHASAPAREHTVADAKLCMYPTGDGVCAFDLSESPVSIVPEGATARDERLTAAFVSNRCTVAGEDAAALQIVRAWQTSIGLATRFGVAPVEGWGSHRGLQPPRDPKTMHRLMNIASDVVEAPDVFTAADAVQNWLVGAGIRSPHADLFSRTAPPSVALQPVITEVLARYGRTHTRIRRLADMDGQVRLRLHDWEVDDVPQMVWTCALPAVYRRSTNPDQRILRAVMAMILIRMHGTRTWVDAGAALHIPADKARNWTRHVFASRFGLRKVLIDASSELALCLSRQPARHAWIDRPCVTGYGVYSLNAVQQPDCRLQDSSAPWCPCTWNGDH